MVVYLTPFVICRAMSQSDGTQGYHARYEHCDVYTPSQSAKYSSGCVQSLEAEPAGVGGTGA